MDPCLEHSGCTNRLTQLEDRADKTDEKMDTVTAYMQRVDGAMLFLKWGIPISITVTGIFVTVAMKFF